ncbi:MAG: polymer-forming cytoskeletal protein [Deltaproteobacteria bacterium]|nr:polymer-forming cytoskeletal protein [Deltaproteobacteria bacterium]
MDSKTVRESVVAQGTSIRGTVTSECPVTVSGAVDGELTAPALVVTDSGSVSGKVTVDELTSSGELSGTIDAGILQLSGRVCENTAIRAKSLEVKLSSAGSEKLQVVFGSATLEVGPDPGMRRSPPSGSSEE